MAAPVGSVVRIYFDRQAEVAVGHVIRTEAGRLYQVVQARLQARGKHAGRRWHLHVLVLDDWPEVVAAVHPLRWYKRKGRSKH